MEPRGFGLAQRRPVLEGPVNRRPRFSRRSLCAFSEGFGFLLRGPSGLAIEA